MLKFVLFFGLLSVVCSTPVRENEITKEHIDLASKEFSAVVEQAQEEWVFEAMETNEHIESMYSGDVRSSYEKLQAEIETAIRDTTNYTISKIIPFLNQSETNRDLLQCIDLRNNVKNIDEAVQKVVANVHRCKWNMTLQSLDDLYWIKEIVSYPNSNLTKLDAEGSKCTQNTSMSSYPEVLQCLHEVKEKVLQAKEGFKLYLMSHVALYNEKLKTRLNAFNECKTRIDFTEVRKVQDEQFETIEKCLSEQQKESSDNATGIKHGMSSEDMFDVVNNIQLHIRKLVKKASVFVESWFAGHTKNSEAAIANLDTAEGLYTIEIIEKKWQANGNENKSLSTFLTSDEYSELLQCSKQFKGCSSTTYLRAFVIETLLGNMMDIDIYRDVDGYFSEMNVEAKKCMENLNNTSNFYDAVKCILQVDGQTPNILEDEISRVQVANEVVLQNFLNKSSDYEKCNPLFLSPNHLNSLQECFGSRYKQAGDAIFKP